MVDTKGWHSLTLRRREDAWGHYEALARQGESGVSWSIRDTPDEALRCLVLNLTVHPQ